MKGLFFVLFIFFIWMFLFQLQAAGFPEPELIHFNAKEFDFGKKKAFPFRDQVKMKIFSKLYNQLI